MDLTKINETKKDILKNFKPVEMEAYIKSLISNLYEAFINNDSDKALASKELIEEATSIYGSNYNNNKLVIELKLRLASANEWLIKTLEEKNNIENLLHEETLSNLFTNQIETLTYSNMILNILVSAYEREPSENLLRTVKEVHDIIKLELTFSKVLLENNYLVGLVDHKEKIDLIQDSYNRYEKIATKIDTF